MNIVFRVDAALHIGSGHVMRCLTLADALTQKGANCQFICREFEGNLFSLIENKGYLLHRLPKIESEFEAQENQLVPHEHWLGISYDQDASETINILQEQKIDINWLIIDHYAIDIRWEKLIRPYVNKIMLIDDLADRQHDCDLLLDQNYFNNFEHRYDHLITSQTQRFLGPHYALLNKEFQNVRSLNCSKEQTSLNQVLVFFGAVDSSNETRKFLQGHQLAGSPFKQLHVVLGSANQYSQSLLQQYSGQIGIRFYHFIDNMAELMEKMDYAFGACGTTNWERMCLGLNCSIVSVAENQIVISHFLNQQNLIDYIGDCKEITEKDYERAIRSINLSVLNERKKKIMDLVDGEGVVRIANYLTGISYET